MEKQSRAMVDGTFLGPDATAELVAMHLHRLGAARATSITFVADGAPWIWERLPAIVRLAKLDAVPIHEILDCCHAAHHISLALAALGQTERERMPLYREHRTLLRNGQWRRVVEELTGLAEIDAENEEMRTEIAYLRKHGEAGRLQYGVRLDGAAKGMGIAGKPEGMNGAKASLLWTEGKREEVLQYVAQDVRTTLELADACEASGVMRWIARGGKRRSKALPGGWLSVDQAQELPLPDTSWMDDPWPREKFTGWMG